MVKRKAYAPWLIFAVLCLLGGGILLFPSYRFSGWVVLGIAAVVLCYQMLNTFSRRSPKFCKILRRILTACVCLVLTAAIITGFLLVRTANQENPSDCDYLIVLGAGVNGTVPSLTLRERLDAAYGYLQAHPETVCIVSGGQGPGEEITEAECMADWLINKGIAPERILLEDQATSTRENLAFSKALAESHRQSQVYTVGIVSSEYHLFRAALMANEQEISPILVPARTKWVSLRINYYLREIAAVWYYLVFRN